MIKGSEKTNVADLLNPRPPKKPRGWLWLELKRIASTRLAIAWMIIAGVCLFTYFIKHDDSGSPQNPLALLFDNAEGIAIISAGLIYILEAGDRKKRNHYEAWQVINLAQGQGSSGGRIQALEDLNVEGVDLEGLSTPEADLSGINLRGARLARADLRDAQLDKANLREAKLQGAKLQETNLRNANLEGADLEFADLRGATLDGANLKGAILWDAKLQEANLSTANLRGSSLRGADLEGATLAEASLEGAFLFETNLRGTKWGFSSQGELEKAELCRTTLPDGSIVNRDCKRMGIDPETGSWITFNSSDAP